MNNDNAIETLYQYASDYRFHEFDLLLSAMEEKASSDEFFEAYLMRAQIKLYTADLSILEDLSMAKKAGVKNPQFPMLKSKWKGDSPNRFIVFPTTPGALQAFLEALPQIGAKLALWYGEQGHILARQIESEIYYFTGDTERALMLAEEQYAVKVKSNTDAIWALIVQYRCNLALAQPQKAEQNMFDIIRCSKAYPECVEIYKAFRVWVNLTTGWNGDSPRFYEDKDGKKQPVFKDRLEGINMGIARSSTCETPFVEYAKRSYDGTLMLRHLYMVIFNAMYWTSVGDCAQVNLYFTNAYDIARASGIVMPLIESGEQIMPLIKYIKDKNVTYASDWLDDIMARAVRYEECLRLYQTEDSNG